MSTLSKDENSLHPVFGHFKFLCKYLKIVNLLQPHSPCHIGFNYTSDLIIVRGLNSNSLAGISLVSSLIASKGRRRALAFISGYRKIFFAHSLQAASNGRKAIASEAIAIGKWQVLWHGSVLENFKFSLHMHIELFLPIHEHKLIGAAICRQVGAYQLNMNSNKWTGLPCTYMVLHTNGCVDVCKFEFDPVSLCLLLRKCVEK